MAQRGRKAAPSPERHKELPLPDLFSNMIGVPAGQPPADQGERDRIVSELDTTMLVEAAAGTGKTYRMINEAHDLRHRGIDVVIAFVETHGRALANRLSDDDA